MSFPRFRLRTLLVAIAICAGALAAYRWWQAPPQRVPRLMAELADRPGGNIDIFWRGRSTQAIETDLDAIGADAVPVLIDSLHSTDPETRYLAAGQLGRFGDRRAYTALVNALNDPDDIVRQWAIRALGDLRDARAVARFLPLLQSDKSRVVWLTAQALGKLGDQRAVEPLMELTFHEDLYVQAHAVEALGNLRDRRAAPRLLQLVQGVTDSWVQREAVVALGKLGDTRAMQILTSLSADPDPRLSAAASEAIAELRGE